MIEEHFKALKTACAIGDPGWQTLGRGLDDLLSAESRSAAVGT
jgi:hypothetical protein